MIESLQSLVDGLSVAILPANIGWLLAGCLAGTLVGVLPGLGSPAAIALLLPVTVRLSPTSGLIMLAGIYYGSEYGGKTTAILLNIPGESGAIMTCLDGYPMAKQGRAGPALGISAIASFVGGVSGMVALTLLADPIAAFAINFGPPEFFGLVFLGLATVVAMTSKSMLKGLISATLGLFFALVGVDILAGRPRFIFGQADLLDGISFVAVVVGMFAVSEVLINVERTTQVAFPQVSNRIREFFPSRDDLRRTRFSMIRGSVTGFIVGALPGAGATVGSFLGYMLEQKVSKEPERFGNGAIEGVAAPEAANNAAAAGAFIPLLTLGIPGSGTTAIMLGALILYGIQPGPTLIDQQPELVWSLIASMILGNVALLVLNLPLVPAWASLLRIPYGLLYPGILVLSIIGVYSVHSSLFDLWVLVFFSLLGYAFRKLSIPIAPLVLAFVLGILAERAFRQSMVLSQNDPSIFLQRPLALVFLLTGTAFIISPFLGRLKSLAAARVKGDESSSETTDGDRA